MTWQTFKKIPKKVLYPVCGVLAALIIFFIVRGIVVGTCHRPVNKLEDTVNSQDADIGDYIKAFTPTFFAKGCEKIEAVLPEAKELLDGYLTDFYDKYDIHIKLKIADKEKLTSAERENLQEVYRGFGYLLKGSLMVSDGLDIKELSGENAVKLQDILMSMADDLSKVRISKGYSCTLSVKFKVNGNTATASLKNVNLIRMNGKWVFDYVSVAEAACEYLGSVKGIDLDFSDLSITDIYKLIKSYTE